MNEKRIIIFCTHAYPYRGGLEKNVLELASRLVSRGAKVDLCCFNSEKVAEREAVRGVNFYRLKAFKFLGGTYTLPIPFLNGKILNELAKNNYDCVITQTRFFFSTFLGYRFAKKIKKPLIHVERGTTFVKHKNPVVSLIAFLVDQTWGRFLVKKANKIVGVSRRALDFIKLMGCKDGQVIHNGIEFRNDQYSERNNERLIIAFAGRLISGKGVLVLLDALGQLTEDLKNKIVVRFYGFGPAKEEMIIKIKNLGLEKIIEFKGEIDSEVLRDELRKVDIFINPSFSEGLPTSVLEAAEAGCAVIASDVGGTDEIIEHEISGLIVKSYDTEGLLMALEKLIKDKVLRNAYGHEAQRFVRENFSWQKVVEQYEKLIAGL